MSWLDALARHAAAGSACVVVTIEAVRGSAPRSVGTRMTVGADGFDGTIGGGALELAGLERARALLRAGADSSAPDADVHADEAGDEGGDKTGTRVGAGADGNACGGGGGGGDGDSDGDGGGFRSGGTASFVETFPLGRALSQCCGGEVTLRFELHPAVDFRIEVFGAGHVGQELARLLVRLPCRASFHDPRAEWLERLHALDGAEALRTAVLGENVHAAVEAGHAGAYWLVMTHSHELDLEVVEAVLARGDSRYCGLIASDSKAASFRGRLARKGFSEVEIARLTAPLGQRVDTGNTPMEVAVAAVADVLSARAVR